MQPTKEELLNLGYEVTLEDGESTYLSAPKNCIIELLRKDTLKISFVPVEDRQDYVLFKRNK